MRDIKKRLLLITSVVFILGTLSSSFGQSIGEVAFINSLGKKSQARYSEAITMYAIMLRGAPAGAQIDSSFLIRRKIILRREYKPGEPLRRGILARMIARHLELKDSLMYRIFGTERYAYRACIAAGLMEPVGSERDILSGEELIEIIGIVSERTGGSK